MTLHLLPLRLGHPPLSLLPVAQAAAESRCVSWLGAALRVLARVWAAYTG